MEKWANGVWSTHFRHTFRGKKIRKPPLGYFFFLRGKSLITKSGRTHMLQKISSKNLTSKRYITFALIALTHYPGPWGFSWFFLLFTKRRIRVATRVNRFTGSLAALSCGKRWTKTSGNRVTAHRQKNIYSLTIQLYHVNISAKSNKTTSH